MPLNQIFGLSLLLAIAIVGAVGGPGQRTAASEPQPQPLYCYEKHREEAPCVKCCDENYEMCKKELGCPKSDWRCQNPCWEFVKYCDYQCKL